MARSTATKSKVRDVPTSAIAEAVARLCTDANNNLPEDVLQALQQAREREESPGARHVLGILIENAQIAAQEKTPLCQDTGTTIVFVELGQDAHIVGGDLDEAINAGVRKGYIEGFLRKSIAKNPFTSRINTGDNTPAVVHTEIVPGDKVKITVIPKGGGCENMSKLVMLRPADGRKGLVDFVVQSVESSGGNPCPPVIVGVGVGGSADKAVLLAKKAIMRQPVGQRHPDPEVAKLEEDLLEKVNALGIGPQAWGGRTTALAVHVEVFPTHITSLPVAVNLQCHSARQKTAVL
ncbi:MAG: fumarate hydratase [Chloroflexi bacterium]|nr:fumarate hydratase [Chloroflexota bacterium]